MTQNLGGRDAGIGSVGKVPALQTQGPEFDVQSPPLKKKKKIWHGVTWFIISAPVNQK